MRSDSFLKTLAGHFAATCGAIDIQELTGPDIEAKGAVGLAAAAVCVSK